MRPRTRRRRAAWSLVACLWLAAMKLGAFNYCSRDITYVPIHRDEAGGGWSAGTLRYVSPCDTL